MQSSFLGWSTTQSKRVQRHLYTFLAWCFLNECIAMSTTWSGPPVSIDTWKDFPVAFWTRTMQPRHWADPAWCESPLRKNGKGVAARRENLLFPWSCWSICVWLNKFIFVFICICTSWAAGILGQSLLFLFAVLSDKDCSESKFWENRVTCQKNYAVFCDCRFLVCLDVSPLPFDRDCRMWQCPGGNSWPHRVVKAKRSKCRTFESVKK